MSFRSHSRYDRMATHSYSIHLYSPILTPYSPLQTLHRRLWLDSLRPDHISDLERVGDVLRLGICQIERRAGLL